MDPQQAKPAEPKTVESVLHDLLKSFETMKNLANAGYMSTKFAGEWNTEFGSSSTVGKAMATLTTMYNEGESGSLKDSHGTIVPDLFTQMQNGTNFFENVNLNVA